MTPDRRYHQGMMEANTPPPERGPVPAPERPLPPYGAPQQQWPTPPPPGAYLPPAKPSRSLWIIFAGIVIAGALIAGAAFLALSGKGAPAPTAGNPAVSAPVADAPANAASSSTCKAWKTTRATLDTIPELPAGWDWNTPNIDTYISNRNAATAKALDLFEPKIAQAPADVATAARDYVTAKRNSIRLLADKSFTPADAVSVNAARAQLDQLCDVN